MFDITGRVHAIHIKNEKCLQIVLKKRMKGKETLVAFDIWGYHKKKVDALHLVRGDKIGGRVYMKSRFYKERWYADVWIEDVERVEIKSRSKNPNPGEQARMLYQ